MKEVIYVPTQGCMNLATSVQRHPLLTGWQDAQSQEAGQDVIYVARPTGSMHLTASVSVIP